MFSAEKINNYQFKVVAENAGIAFQTTTNSPSNKFSSETIQTITVDPSNQFEVELNKVTTLPEETNTLQCKNHSDQPAIFQIILNANNKDIVNPVAEVTVNASTLTINPSSGTINSDEAMTLTRGGTLPSREVETSSWSVDQSFCKFIDEYGNEISGSDTALQDSIRLLCSNASDSPQTATITLQAGLMQAVSTLQVNPSSMQIFPPNITANSGDIMTFKFHGTALGTKVWEASDSRCRVIPIDNGVAVGAEILSSHAENFTDTNLENEDLVLRIEAIDENENLRVDAGGEISILKIEKTVTGEDDS